MASLNKVQIIGNLGKDPEVRQAGDALVADFSVAVTEKRKDGEKTEWVTVVAWRRLGEIARDYLRKGSQVYIEGKLSTRSWQDKTTGAKRYATEVVAENIQMLGSRSGSSQGGQSSGYSYNPAPVDRSPAPAVSASGYDDDLPF